MADGVWLATAVLGAASTALVLLLVWADTVRQSRREASARRDVHIEVQQWAAGRGWQAPVEPPRELFGDGHAPDHGNERPVVAAEGVHAGYACAVLVYEVHHDDSSGTDRYLVCMLRLTVPEPARQVLAVPIKRARAQIDRQTLRVTVAGWPPKVDLDAVLNATADLATSLQATPPR